MDSGFRGFRWIQGIQRIQEDSEDSGGNTYCEIELFRIKCPPR